MSRPWTSGSNRTRTCSTPTDLGSSAEYHNDFLDQRRRLELGYDEKRQQDPTPRSARRWLPTRPKTSDSGCGARRRSPKSRKEAAPPQLSQQEVQEFETLPLAVRRKYFSTLERLRFAQTSGTWDDCSTASTYCPSPSSCSFPNDQAFQRRDTAGLGTRLPGDPISRSFTSPDCSGSSQSTAGHPKGHLTREQQVVLARNFRDSVLLDAADEAFLRIGRDPSRHSSFQAPPSRQPSMEARFRARRPAETTKNTSTVDTSFYDSFRWMDKDDGLDLNLHIDNLPADLGDDYHGSEGDGYHIDSTGAVSTEPPRGQRPSFRRHMSITKIPFCRSSFPSTRPANMAGLTTPVSPTATSGTYPSHTRRRSRNMSLMNVRHVSQESTRSVDAAAAHYQDPEARLKLRVYLASPQKFDEAIEFGFPATDALASQPGQLYRLPKRTQSEHMLSEDSSNLKTFFSDDQSSTNGDDASLPDPDSPRTPHSPDKFSTYQSALGGDEGQPGKLSGGYAHASANSREMTLRMTLTRPDLRAGEDQIYGWQRGSQPAVKSARPSTAREESRPSLHYIGGGGKPKENMDRLFAVLDEEQSVATEDRGVVRRIWNKMRRG